ncbi:MAG: Flp pilus assembly protein TadB [Firmicutes bacterium]|nr:Flp pilus assembly protein TadB [Bacillota bacterium]
MQLLTALLILSTICFYYFLLLKTLFKKNIRKNMRIDKYLIGSRSKDERELPVVSIKSLARKLGKILIKENRSARLELQLMRAGILLKSEEFILVIYFSTLIPPVIIYLITGNIFAAAITSIIGCLTPKLALNAAIKRRLDKFNLQLPDAINIIIYSLKSGLSLMQAMESVANEMADPIRSEFERTVKEITVLSRRKEDALENMNKRVNSDDLDLVVTAVIIQSQVGGNLAEILENIVETVRDRIKIKGEIRALTAQGRMSGIIVASVPVFVGAVILFIDPTYFEPFIKYPLGWLLIGYSIVSEALGFIFIKQIMSIDF